MNIQRINLQNLILFRKENELAGNSTSVRGEYFLPSLNTTAFYKMNGCMCDAHNDEDLRELLASQLLDEIGIPHTNIMLAHNGNEHGCLSLNILNKDERFVQQPTFSNVPIRCAKDYIENDISEISTLPNISSKTIENRKTYLIQLLYYSAILSNTDISSNNTMLIYNNVTGQYRNPEAYDLGLSFSSDSNRTFFADKGSTELLKELYDNYPTIISPIALKVEKQLTPEKINEFIANPIYDDFNPEVKKQIVADLNARIDLVKEYNKNILGNNFKKTISISSIAKKAQGIDINLKDKVRDLMFKLKNRVLGKEDMADGNFRN